MDPSPPPANQPPQRAGWWARNWKWFVPTGCLAMLLLAAGFVFFIIAIVFGAMKSSDAYKMALARAKADPRVVSALGSPIEDGFFATRENERERYVRTGRHDCPALRSEG